MNETKPWYLSKTLWLNVITLVIMVCGYLSNIPAIGPIVAVVLPILNIILRFITTMPLAVK